MSMVEKSFLNTHSYLGACYKLTQIIIFPDKVPA